MKSLLLLVMLTACSATPRDLSGKMFVFPQQSSTSRVTITASSQDFSAATICHRSFTDLRRDHGLFSLATASQSNSLLIFWDSSNSELEGHIRDVKTEYPGLDYKMNTWHSICTTWESQSGLVQLWLNGQPTVKKYSTTLTIRGSPIVILGQEQDSHGGGFDSKQSFVGMMSDVHMWDHVLSPCEIRKYVDGITFTPGNVINWSALEFQITERVLIEDKQNVCF